MYKVKLRQFEGPLDLLLNLIEEEKLDVTRISLTQVADQYLEYISNREDISLENLAEFLSIASKIILIKSKSLLPFLELSEEEEEEIKDLEQKLVEYKKFKEVSNKLGKIFSLKRRSFSREGFWGVGSIFYPPANINAHDFKKVFSDILSGIPVFEKLEEDMIKNVVSIEEKITHLQNSIREKIETSFSDLVSQSVDRVEVIVSFLAMLELIKQRIINAEQEGVFGEIKLKNQTTK